MSGFLICQGSYYNENSLVLEQATFIFEMELYFWFGNHTLFYVLHFLELFLVIAITFPNIQIFFLPFNDTHREELCLIKFGTRMAGWLLLTFLICLHNQLSYIIRSIITCKSADFCKTWSIKLPVKMNGCSFQQVLRQFGLVFVFTLETAFPERFHFKANRKSIGFSKKRYWGFSK